MKIARAVAKGSLVIGLLVLLPALYALIFKANVGAFIPAFIGLILSAWGLAMLLGMDRK